MASRQEGKIRVIAVDWSGDASRANRKIWLAEVRGGELIRLESGRGREEVVDHLVATASDDPELVVGFDFAFSLPAWFLDERGLRCVRELWELVNDEGEAWLDDGDSPFWGRPGRTQPDLPAHYRRTEQEVKVATGSQPKSPFQIGGVGAVGTGSLRGMPFLHRLDREGFSIWPFDDPLLPLVIEIYPRLLTGDVVKSDPEARLSYLQREFPRLTGELRDRAANNEHAFDAAVSALVMDGHAKDLGVLERPGDLRIQKEGAIWWPKSPLVSAPRLRRALSYAAGLHAYQERKGTDGTPYVAHLLGVCSLVLEAGGDEDQAIAALLHDAAEDQGGRQRLEDIREQFGDRVARIVESCTDTFESPKPEWRPRKEAYVSGLADETEDVLLVACADKLYNARAILRDYRRVGDQVFERFNAEKEETLWYYRLLADAFVESELDSWLVDELRRTVNDLEAAVG